MEQELLRGAPELVWIPVESKAETHTGPARYNYRITVGRYVVAGFCSFPLTLPSVVEHEFPPKLIGTHC